jgi:hypothetical protein
MFLFSILEYGARKCFCDTFLGSRIILSGEPFHVSFRCSGFRDDPFRLLELPALASICAGHNWPAF